MLYARGRKPFYSPSLTTSFLPHPFHSHTFSLGELRHDVFIFIFALFLSRHPFSFEFELSSLAFQRVLTISARELSWPLF